MEPRRSIVERFERVVDALPAHVAIRTSDTELTYEQLNKRANGLAHLIRNVSGQQESNVTLLLDHSEEAVIGMLGVLKAGRTYVPIDPLFPLERSRMILNNSGANTLITTGQQLSLARKLVNASAKPIRIINLSAAGPGNETNPGLVTGEAQDAYILYTSGSTGQPKGVAQSHRNVVSLIEACIREMRITAADNLLLTTPYSHTVAFIDIFCALFSGAALSVVGVKKHFEVQHFAGRVRQLGATILHTVPTFYRHFLKGFTDPACLGRVRLVILGGEEVLDRDVALYRAYFPDDCLLVNLYGSSEVILGTFHVLNKQSANDQKSVPIGRPFDVLRALVLDESHQEVGASGTGELYLSAPGLEPKYYKDPRATADLVVTPGGYPGERLVKMGDLVQRLPDGSLVLMGRKDSQVKIAGNRVHLSEIEAHLDAHDAIAQSAVVPVRNDNQDVYLVAYLQGDRNIPDAETLKEKLRQKLPEYMIPSFFVKVEKMPITTNGKIDRKSLPPVTHHDLVRCQEESRQSELQKSILNIWKNTLHKEDITIHDSFFRLGGSSLTATAIAAQVSAAMAVEVEPSELFGHQSVYEMARFLEIKKKAFREAEI